MKLREVTPLRHRRTNAFVMRARGCTMEEVTMPVFEPSAMAVDLRERRVKAGVRLGEAASRAGVRVLEWSGVETGRLVPDSMDDWETLRKAVVVPRCVHEIPGNAVTATREGAEFRCTKCGEVLR